MKSSRSEVQVNLGMHRQEVVTGLLLCAERLSAITWNFFAAGLIDHNVGKERGEFGRGVPRSRFAEHLAGLGVEGGIRDKCRDESTQAVPFLARPGTAAEPDPCDPELGWRSFHPR